MFRIHQLLAPAALALAVCLTPALRGDEAKADARNQANAQDTFKGTVQSVDANRDQIVVRDAKNHDQTFQIARDAKVRVDDKEARAADLKEGDRVEVTYRREAQNVLASQGEKAGEFASGRVERVSADNNQIVLKGHDGQERTFQVAQNAQVRVGNKEGKLADVKEGDHAVVAYTKSGETSSAREIMAEPEGRGMGLAAGQVERVSADRNEIVLKDNAGHEHAFQLMQDARVRINDREGKASALQQGDQAAIAYSRVASEVTGQRGNK